MRLRKAERAAASVPPAALDGAGLWFDGVGGGGPGNMLPPAVVPGADATAAPVEEEEEDEAAMEMEWRRPERHAEGVLVGNCTRSIGAG